MVNFVPVCLATAIRATSEDVVGSVNAGAIVMVLVDKQRPWRDHIAAGGGVVTTVLALKKVAQHGVYGGREYRGMARSGSGWRE